MSTTNYIYGGLSASTISASTISASRLKVNAPGSGTSITALGIDASGNVVSGATAGIGIYWTSGSSGSYSVKVINDSGLDATGSYSTAEGNGTIASGSSSHAEGNGTQALGENSHTEGTQSIAIGYSSHAEGYQTRTSGETSHAEGYYTSTIGNYSHTEGSYTTSIGVKSHSEGSSTISIGDSSHAEGYLTTSIGDASHSEGSYSIASAQAWLGTITDGVITVAYDWGSEAAPSIPPGYWKKTKVGSYNQLVDNIYEFAETPTLVDITGYLIDGGVLTINISNTSLGGNKAILLPPSLGKGWGGTVPALGCVFIQGNYSHVEGAGTQAYYAAHSEGSGTMALGNNSHAEGGVTIALGDNSHSEGTETVAIGYSSHAEGYYSMATGETSHAEGYYTTANGVFSHAEGSGTIANGKYSHSEGYISKSIGDGSHSEGGYYDSGSDINYSGGTAIGNASHAEGVNTTAIGISSHAEGYSTTAGGSYSHAEGQNSKALSESSHAEGDGTIATNFASHAEGQSTIASGDSSHAEGISTTALGDYSHSQNSNTIAMGQNSHAEGNQTIASGFSSHAEGQLTTAIGNTSHVEGFSSIALGVASHVGGSGSTASGAISFIHSTNSSLTGDRSAIIGGQNITGSTADTVYVPNLNINTAPSNDNTLTQLLVRDTDGTIKYRSSSSISGSTGVFGISNSGGTYTYYATLSLAMSAASAGQTIEVFADYTESVSGTTVLIKPNVILQGNGHSYFHTASGDTDTFSFGTNDDHFIYNYNIIRTNATGGYVINRVPYSPYNVYFNGTTIKTNQNGVLFHFSQPGNIYNLTLVTTGAGIGVQGSGSNFNNCTFIGASTSSGALASAGVTLNNCNVINRGTGTSVGDCYLNNTTVISYASAAVNGAYGITNSYIYSLTSYACLLFNGGLARNSVFISSGSYAAYIYNANSRYDNCLLWSTVNNAFYASLGGDLKFNNCVLLSSAAIALNAHSVEATNCTIESLWNNSGGHAVAITSSDSVITNCTLRVGNTSAYALYGASAYTPKYANNVYAGMTTPIHSNITQGIINTHDNQGNILI